MLELTEHCNCFQSLVFNTVCNSMLNFFIKKVSKWVNDYTWFNTNTEIFKHWNEFKLKI